MKEMLGSISLGIFAALAASACAQVTYYPNPSGLPFSDAVQVGDMLYLSGQIGVEPGAAALVPGGIEAESRQAMENIAATLSRRGLDFDSVVKCTVMLADMGDWPAFNTVYRQYFKADRLPARSAFASSGLAYGGRIELECWAYNPSW